MFGLFGSKQDEQTAYDELFAFLTDDWRMKEQYARAFLDAFRRDIAKIHKDILKKYETMERSDNPELRLAVVSMGGKRDALSHVLIAQAYNAYKLGLRRGQYVGTDVELAIWAVLSNRSDLLDPIDKAFANYIRNKYEEKFPRLYNKVFEMED